MKASREAATARTGGTCVGQFRVRSVLWQCVPAAVHTGGPVPLRGAGAMAAGGKHGAGADRASAGDGSASQQAPHPAA